jgi:membrane associated rhomboid family serine protease
VFGAVWLVRNGYAADMAEGMELTPRQTLKATFTQPTSRLMILGWLVVNAIFGVFGTLLTDAGAIAWDAHLGGFLVGLLGFTLFDRPQAPLTGAPPPVSERNENLPTLH